MKKIRVGGITVEETKTYSGSVVLQLIKTSFDNGCARASADMEKEFRRGYDVGFVAGKEEACRTLSKLREAIREVLE